MGAAGSEVDPLTELARLIGQSDSFAPAAQRRPASRDPAPNAASRDPAQPYAAGYDDHAQYPAHDAHDAAERSASGYNAQLAADQAYGYEDGGRSYAEHAYEADRAGHDNRAGYDTDRHGGHPDKALAPRRRGAMLTAAALIGLAIVGAGLAFGYRAVFTPGTPPLIARDRGPNKIIPSSQTAEARGTKGDDRSPPGDQSDPMVSHERMVSHEERPIALPDTPGAPGFGQSGAATLPAPMQPVAPSDVATPAAPDNAGPRKVQTVTIPAEGAVPVPTPAPPRTRASRASAAPGPPQSTPQGAPRPPATPSAPPQAGQAGPLSLSVASAAPDAPRAAARAEAGSGYYVQVAAQRSEEEAQSAFRGIQEKYANLLGGHEPVIRRKDLGDKGIFFGAQVGPFSRESAVQLCENLKSAGGSCMVQKN